MEIKEKNMKKYVEMSKKELDELNKEEVTLVSVMSPIEIHGSHLPLGTDVFIAGEVMKRTVDKLPEINFIQLPDLYTGAQPLPVKGSLGVSYRTLLNILMDFGKGLKEAGFSKWVIFDNHGGPSHMLAEADASRKLKRMGFELIIPFIDIMNGMNSHDPEIGLEQNRDGSQFDAHAGTNETSLYMSVDDSFDDISYPVYKPGRTFAGNLIRLLGSESLGFNIDWISDENHPSYIGEPRKADSKSGEMMLDYHVKKSIEAINGNYTHEIEYNWLLRQILRIIG